jgi:small subunit ribosomal protein S2
VLDGISAEMVASGRDIGASEEVPPAAMPTPEPEVAASPAAAS